MSQEILETNRIVEPLLQPGRDFRLIANDVLQKRLVAFDALIQSNQTTLLNTEIIKLYLKALGTTSSRLVSTERKAKYVEHLIRGNKTVEHEISQQQRGRAKVVYDQEGSYAVVAFIVDYIEQPIPHDHTQSATQRVLELIGDDPLRERVIVKTPTPRKGVVKESENITPPADTSQDVAPKTFREFKLHYLRQIPASVIEEAKLFTIEEIQRTIARLKSNTSAQISYSGIVDAFVRVSELDSRSIRDPEKIIDENTNAYLIGCMQTTIDYLKQFPKIKTFGALIRTFDNYLTNDVKEEKERNYPPA